MHLTELESFSILPLIDWHTARPDLCGEAGVSYPDPGKRQTGALRSRIESPP